MHDGLWNASVSCPCSADALGSAFGVSHRHKTDVRRAAVVARAAGRQAARMPRPLTVWVLSEHGAKGTAIDNRSREALQRHAPSTDFLVRVLTMREAAALVPDLPEEASRLPRQVGWDSPAEDLLRTALLYHHGGIFLGADVVLRRSLLPLARLLEQHDLVAFEPAARAQSCAHGQFLSGLVGARRGSLLLATSWAATKSRLRSRCAYGDALEAEGAEPGENDVCCYESTGELRRVCHVPPGGFAEGVGRAVGRFLAAHGALGMFCLREPHTLWVESTRQAAESAELPLAGGNAAVANEAATRAASQLPIGDATRGGSHMKAKGKGKARPGPGPGQRRRRVARGAWWI